MLLTEFLKALLYGILEGITEWLPISSTGHLILLEAWLPFAFSDNPVFLAEYREMFDVVIQLGAILAVVVLYRNRLFPFFHKEPPERRRQALRLWGMVLIGCIPAGIVGTVGDKLLAKATGKDIDGWLFHPWVVAGALILYGIAFSVIEHLRKDKCPTLTDLDTLQPQQAFRIGLFQTLSMIPGTSRSGSTILGSMLIGLSRPAATEFSFFLAIPVMVGAGGIKMLGFFDYVTESAVAVPVEAWWILAVGCLTSFLVSAFVIRFLTDFVKRHTFVPFGIYRILLGTAVLLYFLLS